MSKYDFYVAGRWRNKDNVKQVAEAIRASGKPAYCFVDNDYKGEKVEFKQDEDPEVFMKKSEALAHDDPLVRRIFETDMAAERAAENFLLVLPAGLASHVEAGAAYGMGKNAMPLASQKSQKAFMASSKKYSPIWTP